MFITHSHYEIFSAWHCERRWVCSDLRCPVNRVYLFEGYDLQCDFREAAGARNVLCGKMSRALVRCSSELAKVISWNPSTRRYGAIQGVDMFPLHSIPASAMHERDPHPSGLILDVQSANAIKKTATIQCNAIQQYFKYHLCWVCYGEF